MDLLEGCFSPGNPHWFHPFWNAVAAAAEVSRLAPEILSLLMFHGYAGASTPVPPRMPELKDSLRHFLNEGPSLNAFAGGGAASMNFEESAFFRWDSALAPGYKRAATEIYRSIRAQGYRYVRDYVKDSFSGVKTSDSFADLWIMDYGAADGLFNRTG